MIEMVRFILFMVLLLIFFHESVIVSAKFCSTNTSTCANGFIVDKPFWIDDGSLGEGCSNYPGFGVKCAGDGTPVMNISNGLYTVLSREDTSYGSGSGSIRVREAAINGERCPRPQKNFSLGSTRFLTLSPDKMKMIIFYNCSSPPPESEAREIQCLQKYYNDNTKHNSYAFQDGQIPRGFDWFRHCEESVFSYIRYDSPSNIVQTLQQGFDLIWYKPINCGDCEHSGGRCSSKATTGSITCHCPGGIKKTDQDCKSNAADAASADAAGDLSTTQKMIAIGVCGGLGSGVLIMIFYNLVVCYCRKENNPTNVEVFLENYGYLAIQRYTYSDIKKFTNSFKETLGQGGYGTVFKGKLFDGHLVAVKLLNEAKGKGEDFINEVAAIGRTNHVNVVSLLGFCTEKNKRALVYEYMSNGSLERFIYDEKNLSTSSTLGREKLYEIALGIAKGLEYLHRGCNTRILHLDIKPHNVLLDQDFCPKISDFGLAKLCPTKESLVSMVGARGTIGYIAPEVCCRNFGGVSHKSDVYSYGMMVLEMIGGRKNIDATVENLSEIYFPQWLYTRLERHNAVKGIEETNIEISGEFFKDETLKKMIMVALWCIQPHPGNRPSTSKVVDMLEGNINELQMAPNPFPNPSSS